ncbi:MAG: hypothetical protein ACHQ4H_11115 [Ktedonobacterales bacterium]
MLTISSLRAALEERLRPLAPATRHAQQAPAATASTARVEPLDWRAVVRRAAGLWLVTRVALAIFTYYAVTYSNGYAHGPVAHDQPLLGASLRQMLHAWQQWDVHWYLTVVQQGYATPTSAAFFPLFPGLARAVVWVLGSQHALLAVMLVSNLATLLAFIGLGLFIAQEAGLETATRGIRLLAAYPLAFFLAAGYGDSLFLALAVFALFFSRRGQWWWAAACAFLAGMTRLTAVILILPLLWEYGRQCDWWRGGVWRGWLRDVPAVARLLALAAAVPLSLGLIVLFFWRIFGDPKLILHVEEQVWHHHRMMPWSSLAEALGNFFASPFGSLQQAHISFDLVPVLLFGVLTVALLRRMPVAFSLYMLGLLALTVMSPITVAQDLYISAGRYLLAAAPIFLVLARWSRRPWLDTLLLATGFVVQAALLGQFLMGHWVV